MEFHPTKRKTYRFTINANQYPDLFNRRRSIMENWISRPWKRGLSHLIGTHDYTTFASRKSTQISRSYYFDAWIEGYVHVPSRHERSRVIHTCVSGNGFLNMVRIIMGTLIEVGKASAIRMTCWSYWKPKPGVMDIATMEQGLSHLIGTHDYTTFASRKSTKPSHVRTIFDAWIEKDTSMCRPGTRDQGVIHTYVSGNGFLRIWFGSLWGR